MDGCGGEVLEDRRGGEQAEGGRQVGRGAAARGAIEADRGVEWATSGKATSKVPANFPSETEPVTELPRWGEK